MNIGIFLNSENESTFLGLTENFWGNVVGAVFAAVITLTITYWVQWKDKKKQEIIDQEEKIEGIFNQLIIPYYADIVSFIDIETMPGKHEFKEDRVAFLHQDINANLQKMFRSISYTYPSLQKSLLSYKRLDYIDSGKGDEQDIKLIEVCYDFLRYIELLCNETTKRSIDDFPKYRETIKNAAMFHLAIKVYNSYYGGKEVMEKVRFPGGGIFDTNYSYSDIVNQVVTGDGDENTKFVKRIEDSAVQIRY
ncbi:hypothetical protein [Lentibacillus daqui]|uniref:hypothetical protein n=1 Tax=Lentibacillus daqui TaxID=2911514 RepID=UPI0022B19FAE|nr:hypothetical protein [Lentibacillus daqui]